MATLLTNHRMSPALRERIEASVSGRRGAPRGAALSPRVIALVRLVVVVVVVAAIGSVVVSRRRDHQALEIERGALRDAVRAESATLTDRDRGAVTRAESWLIKLAGPYEGDHVDESLRATPQFDAAMRRSAVYVRGPIGAFGSSKNVSLAAAGSVKDALLVCLIDPPTARTEAALAPKVRTAYASLATIDRRTPDVRRLHEGAAGLSVLLPPFAARVERAKDARELAGLRAEFARAPLDRAKLALRAELLVVAMDEEDTSGPSELDGERAHSVRVAIVDLASSSLLLRVRRRVDPAGWSQGGRVEYASGLDSCALAVDVRVAGAR